MDVPACRVLYRVVLGLLLTFELLTCVYSQGAGDVWFSLGGTTYQNNSCVALEDIGSNNADSLLCRTNSTKCCRKSDTNSEIALGHWFFPNGTIVPSETTNPDWDFHRTRGKMMVRMHRRRGGVEGIYRCEIPDSTNVTQTIYIGVYTASVGAGDVWFSLRNKTYQNNSCVNLEDIGSTDKEALLCVTNQTACCQSPALGNWFFPNGTRVPGKLSWWDFIRTRSQMVVRIHRTRSGVNGTYRCEIPDSLNVTQTIYIRVYTTNTITETTPMKTVEAITSSVITVVAVVIVFVVVGVVILVVLRAKKKKQLQVNKRQNVMTEKQDIEMNLKQEGITDNLSTNQPPYAVVQTKALPPKVSSKSEKIIEFLSQNNHPDGGYSEIELEPADSKRALTAKPPRQVQLSEHVSEEMESSPVYQDVNQHCDPPSATSVPHEMNIYTEPDTTVEADSKIYDTVYSEPIQPSLFTDAVGSSSDCEDLKPYAPIYTLPSSLPKSEKMPLKVFHSDIREIHELGMGHFGKVILAETVGLSAKDLRLSESDDDKSKSTLVAVKRLKSDAPNATKEAFEKEVNFMSRLTDKNVIRILGVCYEDTPFIMMEYMEKGDLNQYLQKFKMLNITDLEPQGQITTSTLVHMATQIASAMKYLASHNFVHRDLATRNCLVGPNYLVKISDFGMSRSLYDSHYYRIHGRFVLPVRWMAFECFYGKFSQKSDVWAFGVTMWEIFTLAKEQPYDDMSDKQVIEDALKGKNRKIPAKPDMCPVEVYKIMLGCWAHNSKRRATFQELFQLLTSFQNDE